MAEAKKKKIKNAKHSRIRRPKPHRRMAIMKNESVYIYIYIYFFFFFRKELIKIRIVIFVQFTIIYFHIDWLVLFMHIGHI